MALLLTGSLSDPQYYLASLDPGKGKTEAVCTFVRAWKSLSFQPAGSVLVGLSRLEEIKNYIDRSGLAEDDYAVLVAKDDPLNDRGRPDRSNARVLFTTQEMLFRRTQEGSFNSQSCFHYQGEPRSLRLWDESLLPARPITVRRDTLLEFPATLRPIAPDMTEVLDGLIVNLAAMDTGDTVHVPAALASFATPPSVLSAPHRDHWENLVAMAGRKVLVQRSNRFGIELVAAPQALPADFAPAIILDASGRVRHTYKVWECNAHNLVRLPEATNDYGPLIIHHWDRAGSRSAFKDPGERQVMLKAAADLINGDLGNDPWLIIHHKSRGADDIREDLKALVTDRADRLQFVHWGNHHGTNKHREARNVVVLGLWHLPDATYTAHHLASCPGGELTVPSGDERNAMRKGEHQHHLLQAICRASVRKSSEGACGACTVYVIGKAAKDTKALLADTFPGAAVHDWRPVEQELKGRALEVAQAITQGFASPTVSRVPKIDVRNAVGFANSQELSQVLRNPGLIAWMGSQGIRNELRGFAKAA